MSDQHPRPWRVDREGDIRDALDIRVIVAWHNDAIDVELGPAWVSYGEGVAELIVAAVNAYKPPTDRERFMMEWENQTLSPEETEAILANLEALPSFKGNSDAGSGRANDLAMKAAILSDSGRAEFPVTNLGVTIDGTVHITGDTADGQPFSIEVKGSTPDGRDLIEALEFVRAEMRRVWGEGGDAAQKETGDR